MPLARAGSRLTWRCEAHTRARAGWTGNRSALQGGGDLAHAVQVGSTGIGTVSAGIAEALVTTAVGLAVAIPAVWMFNYFQSQIEFFGIEMANSSSELVAFFMERQAQGTR